MGVGPNKQGAAKGEKAARRAAKRAAAQEETTGTAAGEEAARRTKGEKAARRAAKMEAAREEATGEVAVEEAATTPAGDEATGKAAGEEAAMTRGAPVAARGRKATKAALPPEAVERLVAIRRENLVDASQPLVLIAQPPRSGGTLLSQLVDGHPELHAHPSELKIAPDWPSLDVADPPEFWMMSMQPKNLFHDFQDGYSKDAPARKLGHHEQLEQFPFMLIPDLYNQLFLELAAERTIETQRHALDLHFTSLFNAWIDNQNLYGGPKRWIVAMRGKLRTPENLAKFFEDYPDGRHIACVREPKAKIASKRAYITGKRALDEEGDEEAEEEVEEEAEDAGTETDLLSRKIQSSCRSYRTDTERQIQTKERYGDQVFLLTFENLVTETERTMRALADWLDIEFHPILTLPTFNRFPIKANSSYRVSGHGVRSETMENWRSVFTDEQGESIDERTRDVYERACAVADV